jgi:aarF domain-containing kinase
MDLKINDLITSLPLDEEMEETPREALQELIQKLSKKSVPVGALNRLWILGTLQAKIAAAYMVHWVRSCYTGADKKEQSLKETHLKAALKLLGGMSYMRGAIMKVGQIMANYPDVVPEQFADLLGRLHFEAPPMHYSMLREFVRRELGSDPQEIFDDFETEAFAAASLGQVHRARLKGSGQPVAVKIQYPNIARTIHDDYRNMKTVIFPMRFHPDWDNLKNQFEDVRDMLDMEADYEREADHMEVAIKAFTEKDRVVVPRVYREHSSKRVLTMDYLEGIHLPEYLATGPSQEDRDRFGTLVLDASFRLYYGANLLHADPHPGNYFFMPDGRLGLLDFGCCLQYTQEDLDYLEEAEKCIDGPADAFERMIARAAALDPDKPVEEKRLEITTRWCDWVWKPMRQEGPFDFGDQRFIQEGIDLYAELLKKRIVRSIPLNTWLTKCFFGIRALLSRLKANVDMNAIWKRETWVK